MFYIFLSTIWQGAFHDGFPYNWWMKNLGYLAGYFALYVFLDWVSYIHPVLPLAITPWNPPPGLSLALLLLLGLRYWPALFFAALLAELLVRGLPAPFPYAVLSSLFLTACYAGAATLLRGPLHFDSGFRTLRDLFVFLLVVSCGALLAALCYVSIYTYAGIVPADAYLASLLRFWVGDLIGIMVVTPLILAHAGKGVVLSKPGKETIVQGASLLLALWLIFGLEFTDEFKFFYLLFLPLIWIAMRHGFQGATLALLVSQLGLIGAVLLGSHHTAAVVELQLLMLALAITGLFLGMAVTSRRAVEEKLQAQAAELNQALRLAAAGEMAAALAHELNQPLSALGSYARSCQLMLSGSPADLERISVTMDKMGREVGRAGEVVRRLRDFFRGGTLRLESVAVTQLVGEGLEPIIRQAGGKGMAFHLQLQENLPAVQVDRVQIATVLRNLVSNAMDALADSGGTSCDIHVTAAAVGQDWVKICVEDNGPGISGEMLDNIFSPFATSKPKGMGLGLSISRALVEAHGGELRAEALVAGGARFCFTLPVEKALQEQHEHH